MIYINPSKDFDDEGKIAIKIQINNSLDLGWKKEDILLATNFPYQYKSIKSIILNDDVFVDFDPQSTKASGIVNLFEQGLIYEDTLYWVHDLDAYQMEVVKESELNLGKADMALTDWGLKAQWSMFSYFFKSGVKDIFASIKEIMYRYKVSEEYALMALTTNSPRWINQAEININQRIENLHERVKKLNISYAFWPDALNQTYELATKPIKVLHFHFNIDLLLDSVMHGKNGMHKPIMPERLIKIFQKHGVKGNYLKKMKNLMIYLNPEKRFLDNTEYLVKHQIDNSLKLGWKAEDIVLITNFPYEYKQVKSMILDNKTNKSDCIFHLLTEDLVKEAQLWWYHDLDVFQFKPMDSSQIDLEDMTVGFTENDTNEFDLGSIFFRKGSDKIFEWIRNRANKFGGDEEAALTSLATENYRGINNMYTSLNIHAKKDPLSELAFKYQSDKCPQIRHPYTPFYYKILKDKQESTKKVLEIGVGYKEMEKERNYRTGASLLMWRDFFPNAQIYGIDIREDALYNGKRIKSFIFDQAKKEDLENLIKNIGSDIDLILDDGSHITNDQIFSCLTLMPLVKKNVIYIIEDVKEPDIILKALSIKYECSLPKLKRRFTDDNLIIVTNKVFQ